MNLYIIFALVWIAVTMTLQYIEMCKMRENWESADRFQRAYVNWLHNRLARRRGNKDLRQQIKEILNG